MQHLTIRNTLANLPVAAIMAILAWQIGMHPAVVVLTVLACMLPWPYWRGTYRRVRSAWSRETE